MNDNFLYALRSAPSTQYAHRLKARLDLQASEARQKRRAYQWFIVGALMMGGTALAFVSPSVRQATFAMIVQLRGSEARSAGEDAVSRAHAPVGDIAGSKSALILGATDESGSADGTPSEASGADRVPESAARQSATPGAMVGRDTSSVIVVTEGSRATVRIGHSKSLASLAHGVSVELEPLLSNVALVAEELPAIAKPCAAAFQAYDVVLSEHRLEEGFGCTTRVGHAELPFAYSAIVIVTHRENTWTRSLDRADLRKFREDGAPGPSATWSHLTTWSQLRGEWPTLPIVLLGTSFRQSDTGARFAQAFDLRREPTVFRLTKDDRATLAMVEETFGAIGFIDFGTLTEIRERGSAGPTTAAIVNAKGEAVEPTIDAIRQGRYELARPIRVYVNTQRLGRVDLWSVLQGLYSSRSAHAIEANGFVSLSQAQRAEAKQAVRELLREHRR